MGCCFSSNSTTKSTPHPPKHHLPLNPTPHLPVLEEETVKEVLSETHIPVPAPSPPPPPPPVQELPEAQLSWQLKKNRVEQEEEEEEETSRTPQGPASVVSHQASETCSVTETVDSTATTGSTNWVGGGGGGEDEAVSKRMVSKGNNKLVKSASGRGQVTSTRKKHTSNSSIGKINVGGVERQSRGGRGQRESSAAAGGGVQAGRRVATSRRDGVGERSGRRSRSPATGRNSTGGLGRSGSPGGKVGAGAGRGGVKLVRGEAAGVKKEVENDGGLTEQRRPEAEEEEEMSNNGGPVDNNPLVSLECFIFI